MVRSKFWLGQTSVDKPRHNPYMGYTFVGVSADHGT
jgi:hypothetical protein